MKKHLIVIGIIILILVVGLSGCLQGGCNQGEYYFAYGDSITRATGCCNLDIDGSDCYIMQMRDTYDVTKSVNHNFDGGGQTSTWGLNNFNSHYNVGNDYFVFMFGANDCLNGGMPPSVTANSMVEIYNRSYANGSTPMLCLQTLMSPSSFSYSIQKSRIIATMSLCENYSIPYVKMFDAIDSIPWNGRLDDWNSIFYGGDNVHPDATGHKEMSEFLWYFINGSDYTETYYNNNNTIVVSVDYNETICLDIRSSWYNSSIVVNCTTNNIIIPHMIGYNNKIHFTGVKNCSYEITSDEALDYVL